MLATKKIHLHVMANTKRLILQFVAKNFDIFNFNLPLLNRARLFLHGLQTQKELGWDVKLSSEQIREWQNICKQVNSLPNIEVPRIINKNLEGKGIQSLEFQSVILGAETLIEIFEALTGPYSVFPINILELHL